jgi:hypothetical protein
MPQFHESIDPLLQCSHDAKIREVYEVFKAGPVMPISLCASPGAGGRAGGKTKKDAPGCVFAITNCMDVYLL